MYFEYHIAVVLDRIKELEGIIANTNRKETLLSAKAVLETNKTVLNILRSGNVIKVYKLPEPEPIKTVFLSNFDITKRFIEIDN